MKQLQKHTHLLWRLIGSHKYALIFAVFFIAACATTLDKDKIIFSHNLHSEQGVECADCHSDVSLDAQKKRTAFKMSQCADCHDVEDKEGCAMCHKNPDSPASWQPTVAPSPLIFSHQIHQSRSENKISDCSACHAGAATATTNTTRSKLIPKHAECQDCHDKDLKKGNCTLCHNRLDLYNMAEVDFFTHPPGFFNRHGFKASANETNCSLCHDATYCSDCHNKASTIRPALKQPDRVDKTFIHGGEWLSLHPLKSKTSPASCHKCHGISYCSSCHQRNGIGAGMGQNGANNPHPNREQWVNPGPGSHGAAARKDILSCATCHDQGAASNCVNCHQARIGINPHPPGWKSSVSSTERNTHQTCRICHN